MSDTDKVEDTPVEAVEEPVLETEQPQEEPEKKEPPQPQRRGGGIAWLALLIAVVAAAAAAYTFYGDWQARGLAADSGQQLAALRRQVAEANDAARSLEQQLQALSGQDSDLGARIDGVETDVDQRIRLLDSLPSRMSTLEQSLASLQGLSAGARDTLLIAEAEYYMQIANAQLQLAGNPELATMALTMADDRIVQIADPALTDVRGALADELAALEVMEKPDIEGATLTLASLSRVVESLPLGQEALADEEETAETDPEASGFDRAWASVKGAFKGLVKVNKTDDNARPLLAPEAVYFLRTNLSLQLQAARLALLRGEKSVYEQSLDDASNWIDEYFDATSQQAQAAQQTIAEIRDGTFAVASPDISGSLRLLRQYQTLREPVE